MDETGHLPQAVEPLQEAGVDTSNEGEHHSRLVFLNHMISSSRSRAAQEHKPPLHSADELLRFLERRVQQGFAIEFFDAERNDSNDDAERVKDGVGSDFIRLKKITFTEVNSRRYATLLFDAVDQAIRSMPVLHVVSMKGRDIAGDEHERGSFSAHVVVRLPSGDDRDDGTYRCVVESVAGISRRTIGTFFRRQLRRVAKLNGFEFPIPREGKRGPKKPGSAKYHPDLTLVADVSRAMAGIDREVSQMVFTKRSERQTIADQTEVIQDEVVADVELRISAKQGPSDPNERKGWLLTLRRIYEERGFKTRLFFKHRSGKSTSGSLHDGMDAATDMLLCPKEEIVTEGAPRKWVDEIQTDVRDAMIALLDRDELWNRNAA
ncbi:hypothetical protein NS365_13230 [Aureimonas ureilytica]|uniref:Uncharacterized protein n=2 Tax=Aureimonas ureilytica TaxID=401562 RepID=A0A175RQB6_9HYPH|nr:hypothetical protein NS365_13230 [Aureimonas ureilytica]